MNDSPGPVRVLHVDDQPDLADVTATFLERENGHFTVETATSASDALDRLATESFDCIVSDYQMPGQNGIELLEAVRETRPNLPFILFTGKGSEEIASEAISAGVSDYLRKGTGADRYSLLANRISNLVAQSRAESELEARAQQQQRVAELGQEALAGVATETLFERAVTAVAETLGNEYAKVLEYRPAHDDLLLRAGVGWRDGLVGEATVGTDDDSQAGHTLRSEEPIVVDDLRTEDRFRGPPLLAEHDVVSGVSVCIGSQDDPWGVLGTHTTERTAFTEDDVNFVQSVAHVLATAIERTERESELRQKTRAIQAAPLGISISDPTQDDNPLVYVNDRFETLTGYSADEAIGRNCRFLQGEETAIEPVATLREAIDDRVPVTVELRNYRKDGTPFWNRVTVAPITDAGGTLTNFVGFQEDITQRMEREQDREATLEFLRSLYDVATDTTLDAEAKISRLLKFGPEKLGLPYGHLTRIEVEDEADERGTQTVIKASGDHGLLQPGDSCPLSKSYCRKTIKSDGLLEIPDATAAGWINDPAYETFQLGCYIGMSVTVDDELYGTVFFASATPRERSFAEAERTFVRLMGQLVSYELERERITAELQRQNDRLEEFASVASHDLRNPLNIAQGRLELAREECDSDHLDAIGRAHERMHTLIEDLLTLAREGDQGRDPVPVDLDAVATACWQNVATTEATLVTETNLTITADESRVQQLLENLMRNAVEHGGTAVTVTVGELEDGFYVADDGSGIPETMRETVFDIDYSTSATGAGFGLSIVAQVANAHGWEMHVTESVDGGARFEFTGVDIAS